MTLDPDSARVSEAVLLRREMDRQIAGRLQHMEARLDEIDRRLLGMERQLDAEAPALIALNRVVQSGLVLRWLVMGAVGLLAMAATVATAWEAMQKWFR